MRAAAGAVRRLQHQEARQVVPVKVVRGAHARPAGAHDDHVRVQAFAPGQALALGESKEEREQGNHP